MKYLYKLLIMFKDMFINFFLFIKDIFKNKYIIYQLTKRDLTKKYFGSFLGLFWGFIQPAIYVFIIWFVFKYGLKVINNDKKLPFILWLITGLIPWFFISECIISSTQSLIEYSYLIKNFVFRTGIIPMIKIFSSLIIHLFSVLIIILFCLFYKVYPSFSWIQVIYYLVSSIIFLIGISWLTSCLTVFIRDMGVIIINILIQIIFWATPIFWSIDIIPERYKLFLYLNPINYIIQGYRNAFLNNIWFCNNINEMIYFLAITLVLFFAGAVIFKRLRTHFADVL